MLEERTGSDDLTAIAFRFALKELLPFLLGHVERKDVFEGSPRAGKVSLSDVVHQGMDGVSRSHRPQYSKGREGLDDRLTWPAAESPTCPGVEIRTKDRQPLRPPDTLSERQPTRGGALEIDARHAAPHAGQSSVLGTTGTVRGTPRPAGVEGRD